VFSASTKFPVAMRSKQHSVRARPPSNFLAVQKEPGIVTVRFVADEILKSRFFPRLFGDFSLDADPQEMSVKTKLKNNVSRKRCREDGWVAQLVEQRTENPRVPGSIPGPATSSLSEELTPKSGLRWKGLQTLLQAPPPISTFVQQCP
jgi:hypothetical protein